MSKQHQQQSIRSTAGNVGNILLLSLTSIVTACMLYKFPSTDSFDANWLKNGFCISNETTFWWNSHVLSFYADTVFTLILAYLYYVQPKDVPLIQKELLKGAIVSVFGHGLGHLHLGMDPNGMDLRFRVDDLSESLKTTFVNVFALGCIFKGTMPLASIQKLLFTALIATIGFTVFDIEPKSNFIYAQAVIYVFNAIHMLLLPAEHKDTAAYMFFPYLNLPVLAVGVMESTLCQSFLERIGGHAVFDSSIAVGIICIETLSNRKQLMKQKLM